MHLSILPRSPKALLAGDAQVISDIFRERVAYRGAPHAGWGEDDKAFYRDASKPHDGKGKGLKLGKQEDGQ